MHHTVAILIAVLQAGGFHGEFIALFTPLEYRYTGGEYQDELFHYRLFVPATSAPDERMPLIVWLHGAGEVGPENIVHLLWLDDLIFSPPWNRERFPFFLLAVQCPLSNGQWTRTNGQAGDDMINVVQQILEKTLQDYPVDRRRVYLAGISSGGSGSWQLATRYPDYFAAVAPIASAGVSGDTIDNLVDIPVWAFHCTRDTVTPIEYVSTTVKALNRAGGTAHLTEVDATSHDCWNPAFADYHLLDWLLTQRRDEVSPAPGTIFVSGHLKNFARDWKWWQIVVQIGLPAMLILAMWHAVRGRRRRENGRVLHGDPPAVDCGTEADAT